MTSSTVSSGFADKRPGRSVNPLAVPCSIVATDQGTLRAPASYCWNTAYRAPSAVSDAVFLHSLNPAVGEFRESDRDDKRTESCFAWVQFWYSWIHGRIAP